MEGEEMKREEMEGEGEGEMQERGWGVREIEGFRSASFSVEI